MHGYFWFFNCLIRQWLDKLRVIYHEKVKVFLVQYVFKLNLIKIYQVTDALFICLCGSFSLIVVVKVQFTLITV